MSKISQILLSNFKFFNKEEVIDINNNHLLLYGENGSGKSSLFWGIYTLLEASFKQPIFKGKCAIIIIWNYIMTPKILNE